MRTCLGVNSTTNQLAPSELYHLSPVVAIPPPPFPTPTQNATHRRYLFLSQPHYVVEPNLRHLTAQMDPDKSHLVGRVSQEKPVQGSRSSPDPSHGLILSRDLMSRLRRLVIKYDPPRHTHTHALRVHQQATHPPHIRPQTCIHTQLAAVHARDSPRTLTTPRVKG